MATHYSSTNETHSTNDDDQNEMDPVNIVIAFIIIAAMILAIIAYAYYYKINNTDYKNQATVDSNDASTNLENNAAPVNGGSNIQQANPSVINNTK